jgi:hypothetical protein
MILARILNAGQALRSSQSETRLYKNGSFGWRFEKSIKYVELFMQVSLDRDRVHISMFQFSKIIKSQLKL